MSQSRGSTQFTGPHPAFTEYRVPLQPNPATIGIEVQHVRTGYPSIAIPLCLILAGILLALDHFGIIHVSHIWNLWPITLIAAGMEKLYLWTTTPARK